MRRSEEGHGADLRQLGFLRFDIDMNRTEVKAPDGPSPTRSLRAKRRKLGKKLLNARSAIAVSFMYVQAKSTFTSNRD